MHDIEQRKKITLFIVYGTGVGGNKPGEMEELMSKSLYRRQLEVARAAGHADEQPGQRVLEFVGHKADKVFRPDCLTHFDIPGIQK